MSFFSGKILPSDGSPGKSDDELSVAFVRTNDFGRKVFAAVETDLEHPFKRKEATDIQNRKAWTKMETCICGHSEG